MKATFGVGISVLSALAAQGKDFDRTELNAMLDKLAASPEPKIEPGACAMCYEMAAPVSATFDYVCKKCGKHTHYPSSIFDQRATLAFHRDGAARLRGMGLAISLDESALCRHCTSLKDLGMATAGVIVAKPKQEWMRAQFKLQIGDAVVVEDWRKDGCRVRSVKAKGESSESYYVDADAIGQRKYDGDEGTDAKIGRIDFLAWVINGKRTIARREDVALLKAFLSGASTFNDEDGDAVPVKPQIERLRELLGEPKDEPKK